MNEDKTDPPKPVPPPADDDRTLLVPMPAQAKPPVAPDFDTDKTLISPAAVAPMEDDDRTMIVRPQTEAQDLQQPPPDAGPFSQDDGAVETSASVPPHQPPGSTEPPPYAPLQTLEIGTVINKMYRVIGSLDQGGMGRVFKGEEMGTGEPVAIKVILPEMAEDIRVGQMFRREARTLRQLHHDAIVRYFAYLPPDADMNLHVLVMGFIEGTKLSDRLKSRGALTQDEVCSLFLRLADGLKTAHDIGVVHRDLSPDNVMLPDDSLSKAILIDFGISRSSKIKDVTIGNEFAGKLKYVSPEQLGAYGGDTQAQSDVYSLGLLMIACLTGQPVPMGDSIVEAVEKRQSVPDLSPIPFAFQNLLYKALQPDPAQRLQGMGDFISELRAISNDEPITGFGTASPTGTQPPARAVPGLQTAPGSRTQTFMPQNGQTDAPTSLPKESRGIAGVLPALLIIIGLGAGGGWYYMNMATAADGETAQDGAVVRVPDTVDTHLANTATDCIYAHVPYGGDGGQITGFAQTADALDALTADWPVALGQPPALTGVEVTPAQCAALDFVRMFQGSATSDIAISVDASTVTRAEGVVGAIHNSGTRQNWLALVDPNGRIFSLMSQLDTPGADSRRFAFRLPSASPGKYILLATASNAALVRAGAMQSGTEASVFMPLISRELLGDDAGAVAIAELEILP
ncbi:serine/threonine-protein kinase [Yoonia maricola]|uniref:Serine/threonine-protein kinase n=1 Tax=Yoonia maricola TaxID=420999 RepID=A0A2M8VZX5_9RHOB|nr:serine/threonine-protein kinase [Yoonia maricola]PJI84230.1 serine/threonine-protein kinase [Yoonia maricola]